MRVLLASVLLVSAFSAPAPAAVEARDADTDAALALCREDHSVDTHDHQKSADACAFLVSTGQFEGRELARIYNEWGAESEHLDALDDALARYAKALEIWSEYSQAARNIADIHARREEWELSLKYSEIAVQSEPDAAASYRQRAHAHRNLANYDKASADLEIAMALDPENLWTRHEFAWLAYDREDHEQAAKLFQEATERDQQDSDGYYGLAFVLIELDRDASALAAINKAIELETHADYHNLRGFIRAQENKRDVFDADAAAKDLVRAIELDPDLHFPVYHLAAVRVLQDRPTDAITMLKRGLDLRVDKPKGRRVLRLMLRNGKPLPAAEVAILLNLYE